MIKSLSQLSAISISLGLFALPVYADVVQDNTLGTSVSSGSTFSIHGGTLKGTNLFHSFSEFSIADPQKAQFSISPGSGITDIFARVTGNNPSIIDGRIQVMSPDPINLYLINPNGITFGSNASLVLRGSFFASTAESIIFNDGSEFSATNPTGSELLTISVPTAVQFGKNPRDINVQNPSSLEPFGGEAIALVGGNLNIQGGTIQSPNGRVELGSVGSHSRVGINANTGQLNYDSVTNFQDISLSQGVKVSVTGNGQGNINVQGRNISLSEGASLVNVSNGIDSGGEITVNASESLTLRGTNSSNFPTSIQTDTISNNFLGNSAAADVNIKASQITVGEGSQISASTYSLSRGGNVNLEADRITITGVTPNNKAGGIFVRTRGLAPAGNLNITSQDLTVGDRAILSTQTLEGIHNGGDMNINSDRLLVENGAQLQVGTRGAGNTGDLIVKSDTITVRGTGVSASGLFNQVETENATGNAGRLQIDTRELFVEDGAQISAATKGRGNAGDLLINASESVEVTGTGQSDRGTTFSGIITQVDINATGNGGNLELNTTRLNVNSGGAISGGTTGTGEGGDVTISASESITVRGSEGNFTSGISARTRTSANAGNLSIHTQTLTIADGATATVESLGTGDAGNMSISARLIDMNQGSITGETTSGRGGNLTIIGNDIRLLNRSLISTTAGTADAPGAGGNITIVADTIVGLQNSDITANSFRGKGGRIDITAQGIFGLEFRESLTSENDITAISLFNPSLNGEVIIQTPDIDPTQGLTDIPVLENPEPIAEVCKSRATGSRELNLGGRGTPTGSADALTSSDDGLIGAIAPVTSAGEPIAEADRQLVEKGDRELLLAQGWYTNSNGQLVLTETPNAIASQTSAALPRGCNG